MKLLKIFQPAIEVWILSLLLVLSTCTRVDDENTNTSPFFPTGIENLPSEKPVDTLYVANGDTVAITASFIAKTVRSKNVRMAAYNGSIPGPFLNVHQGSTIYIRFTNKLTIPTTLHSHGLRLENAFDGIPGLTQSPVKPGESFFYKLNFPDPGVYWYHPHIREDYTQELGLYGNFIVEPEDSGYWPKVDRQVPLILDDIFLTRDTIPPFDTSTTNYALMGRYGNVMMINGMTDYKLRVTQGDVIRCLFTNAASARPFRIEIPGISMKLVGNDLGRCTQEEIVDNFIIAPAERIIVEALFRNTGTFRIVNTGPDPDVPMGIIEVAEKIPASRDTTEFLTLRKDSLLLTEIESLRPYFSMIPHKRIVLSIDMDGMTTKDTSIHDSIEGIEWENTMVLMNMLSTSKNTHWKIIEPSTGAVNDQIMWSFTQGDKVKIRIFNDPESVHPMQHPIHFHGQRFIVTGVNGIVPTNFAWKDTYLIQSGDSVDILLDIDNPGKWMGHCHISEHLSVNMMFFYDIIN